jgi:hypothetical protein
MSYQTIVYGRAKLYDEVWAEPVQTVAQRYGVSNVALAKVCKKLRVPVPGRGYWQEKAAGKPVIRPSLQALPAGVPSELRVSRDRPEARTPVAPDVAARVEGEKAGPPVVVSPVLTDPHPLVARAAELLPKAKPANGFVSGVALGTLNVGVTPQTLDRALRVADALLKALNARGLRVEVATEPETVVYGVRQAARCVTRVQVDEEWICFGIFERWRVEYGPPPPPFWTGSLADLNPKHGTPRHIPNGVLALEVFTDRQVTTRRTWADGKHQRVELCLNAFIAELHVTADELRRIRAEVERRRLERAEEERQRIEAAHRAEEERRRASSLNEIVGRWRLARDIRQYVEEVERAVDVAQSAELVAEIAWARNYASRIDPVAAIRRAVDGVKDDSAGRDPAELG